MKLKLNSTSILFLTICIFKRNFLCNCSLQCEYWFDECDIYYTYIECDVIAKYCKYSQYWRIYNFSNKWFVYIPYYKMYYKT